MDYTNMPDDIEISRAQKGDQKALYSVLNKTSPFIISICRKWCRPPIESEDVAQESLFTLTKKLDTYKRESSFFTWVYTLTYRTFLDIARKESRRERIAPKTQLDLDSKEVEHRSIDDFESSQFEAIDKVYLAISKLKSEYAQILISIDIAEKSYEQASFELGIPIGTVRSRLARARISLRKILEENGTKHEIEDV